MAIQRPVSPGLDYHLAVVVEGVLPSLPRELEVRFPANKDEQVAAPKPNLTATRTWRGNSGGRRSL